MEPQLKTDVRNDAVLPLPSHARRALASLMLAMLLPSLGTSIANVSLPALAQDFGATIGQLQWVVLSYLLATTVLVVGAGRLGDIAGRKRVLLAGIAVFTLASGLCALAPTLTILVAARALQGAGAAAMMALTLAFVGDIVPGPRSARAIGMLGSTSALGTALGPALGGLLIAYGGWPAVFLVQALSGALALALALALAVRWLPAVAVREHVRGTGFDYRGAVLLAAALGAFSFAMTAGATGFGAVDAVSLALLAAAGFVRSQAVAASPLLPLAAIRHPLLAGGVVMSILVTAVMMATLVAGPFYLAGSFGLDAVQVGLAMACGPAVAIVCGVPAGRMTERFGPQAVIAAGLALMLCASLTLALLSAAPGLAAYLGPLAVLTAGYALFQAANNSAMMASSAAGERGVVSGLVSLSRNLGLIVGASSMASLFAASTAHARATMAEEAALAWGMRTTFLAAAAAVLASMAAAWISQVCARRAAGAAA